MPLQALAVHCVEARAHTEYDVTLQRNVPGLKESRLYCYRSKVKNVQTALLVLLMLWQTKAAVAMDAATTALEAVRS